MENYEKLGSFYLGKDFDLRTGKVQDGLLLYDAHDLTTHAVCVGMTGSGKTGLCVSLLEEAALDGVPALVIDPKGDLGNLLLTFPQLRGEDFLPWIDEDQARRKDLTPQAYAEEQAELWRHGLAKWDQSGERIRRLREAAEFAIYTPGSDAGLPVSILASFGAPPEEVRTDGDLMRDRVVSTATSLLGLMGLRADPLRSREHILISTVLDRLWRQGQGLDLAALIQAIQDPPVERVGVLELDSFFPPQDRFELAMQLNNLLAAPGFGAWLHGAPLDVHRLLYTPAGKPRVAVFSIAHLSDDERMFFVSLLLNQVLAWMRTCPGTSSLRAIVYMDEIFGFVPPTAEPPSKRPLITLLKQARAYGLGVVLATQNPVDLDYKGLSNTGTWLLGRLQTERDKQRVLEGLEGAAAGSGEFDKAQMERVLAGLGKRVFLMHNVHESRPVVFHTRWAMSYLRGPLTRQQIARLMQYHPAAEEAAAASAQTATEVPVAGATPVERAPRPLLAPSVPQVFLPAKASPGDELLYQPALLGMGRIQFADPKSKKVKHIEEVALLQPLIGDPFNCDWSAAVEVDLCEEELERDPEGEASYARLAPEAEKARSYTTWRKRLSDTFYRNRSLELHTSPALGLTSEPGESEGNFRIRLMELSRERRNREADKLRKKYTRKVASLEERIRKAEQSVEREKEQASGQRMQTAISFGATLLSAVLGRKTFSRSTLGRATTAMRGVGRSSKEKQDVRRAEDTVQALQERLVALNDEMESELEQLEARLDTQAEELETTALRPRRSDVEIRTVALAWVPHRVSENGLPSPIWQ